MAQQRRDNLKIIGAISATCTFPFSSDELYGQQEHAHPTAMAAQAALPAKPSFFNEQEFETVKKLADLIIPPTGTPGAVEAGVPSYIDYVVNSSNQWKKVFRDGLAWLDQQSQQKHSKVFRDLAEAEMIALIRPLSDTADQLLKPALSVPARRAATRPAVPREVLFFKAFKGMTAEGYFTSKTGLVDTLGYKGNTVLVQFPSCE
ncbi:MAG: gluconate 2-dehydrogenase subunit 3 family protein [Acidobacteria bacterium]|nr:gluconate 2-dehydrogenase subunit 3 family protein [Acidobacteriota bacterium]